MSDPIQAVYAVLLDLLGTAVDDRVHFATMPPDAVYPCVVYGPIYGGDGVQASGGKGTYRSRFQIDLYGPTAQAALDLRHTLMVGIHNYGDGMIIRSRVDLDVPYYVDELDVWRSLIDWSVDTEWEA